MAKEVYSDIDYRKNNLLNPVIHNVSSFPSNAKIGQAVFNTVLENAYFCIGGVDTTLPSAWTTTPVARNSVLLNFGRDRRNIKSQWLRLNGGGAVSNVTGHRIWKANTYLRAISVQTGKECSSIFNIYKNGTTLIASIELINEFGGQEVKAEVDLVPLDEGDTLSCYMDVQSGNVTMPNLNVEIIY